MTTGELIRQRRKQLNLSAAELAKRILCSKSFISKIETGKRKPSVTMLLRICQALACSTIDILKEEPSHDKPAAEHDQAH